MIFFALSICLSAFLLSQIQPMKGIKVKTGGY